MCLSGTQALWEREAHRNTGFCSDDCKIRLVRLYGSDYQKAVSNLVPAVSWSLATQELRMHILCTCQLLKPHWFPFIWHNFACMFHMQPSGNVKT